MGEMKENTHAPLELTENHLPDILLSRNPESYSHGCLVN